MKSAAASSSTEEYPAPSPSLAPISNTALARSYKAFVYHGKAGESDSHETPPTHMSSFMKEHTLKDLRARVGEFVEAKDPHADVLGDDNDGDGGGDDLGVEFGLNLQIEAEGGSERERERERKERKRERGGEREREREREVQSEASERTPTTAHTPSLARSILPFFFGDAPVAAVMNLFLSFSLFLSSFPLLLSFVLCLWLLKLKAKARAKVKAMVKANRHEK